MTMGFTNTGQLWELFSCGGAGFLIGAYYDVFRVWRLWFGGGVWTVFVQDFFFCVSSAVALFLLSLAVTDGTMRFYVYAGAVGGFFAYRQTAGRFCRHVATLLRYLARKIKAFVCATVQRSMAFVKKGVKNLKKTKKSLETESTTIV